MGIFEVKKSDYQTIKTEGKAKDIMVIKKETFDNFNEDILGLGKIEAKSKQISALSVIFDLEGFTDFCKQIDPQLAVPEYLYEFLKWIFKEIKNVLTDKEYTEGYKIWSELPFLSKYLGDGIMFLWDTENMSENNIRNVVIAMLEICCIYTEKFLPEISQSIISPPSKLRCGIARGSIYSVGNGHDFVGPCINMSARLQKLHSLSFSFSRRGINPMKFTEISKQRFVTKKVNIQGIGEEELVCILKDEYEALPIEDKAKFVDA